MRAAPRVAAALSVALAWHAAAPTGGRAAEGGFVATPIGGTDFRQALLPPPGGYLVGIGVGQSALDFRERDGSRSALLAPEGYAAAGALILGHVFDGTVFGGRVAAAAGALYGNLCLRVRGIGRSQCQTGFGDAHAEVAWSRPLGDFGAALPGADDPRRQRIPYGLTVGVGLGGIIPVGEYKRTDLVPLGFNTFVALPSVAATYVTPPLLFDGTEISARAFYNIHGRNRATDYRTGDLFVLDWGVSERIGRLQFGPTGAWAKQVEPDRQAGRGGPSTSVTSLGASAILDLPGFGMFVQAKFLTDIAAEYRLTTHRAFLRVGFKLY